MENLKIIVASVLGIRKDRIDSLTKSDCAEWDSFNHLMLMSEIEKKIGIKFTIKEIESIDSFKKLKSMVDKKAK